MKKLLFVLMLIAISGCTCFSNEIEDDYFDIAGNYCVVGDYNSAMEYLDKIIKINPSNQRAINLKRGLNHVISNDKKSFVEGVSPSVKTAMEFKRIGNEQETLKYLIKGTQEQNSYLAYYYLGNYYRSKNDYKNAIDAYNSASSSRADFAPAYLSSAIVLYDAGEFSSAINPIDKYLTFNPEDDLAYAVKSRIEFAMGLLNESKADNMKAIQINDCPDYQFDRAKILYKEGKYKESKELFKSLLKDIQTSKIYEYMGLCDYALGDYTSALTDFDRAILLTVDDEYLENKYNEIKELLENKNNETAETTQVQ